MGVHASVLAVGVLCIFVVAACAGDDAESGTTTSHDASGADVPAPGDVADVAAAGDSGPPPSDVADVAAPDVVTADSAPVPDVAPSWPDVQTLRRLTSVEYERSVRELFHRGNLLPTEWDFVAAHPAEPAVLGFTNNMDLARINGGLLDFYARAAELLSAEGVGYQAGCVGDDWEVWLHLGCDGQMVEQTGRILFRRPLPDETFERYHSLFVDVALTEGLPAARQTLLRTMLMSPMFLYRAELGPSDEVEPGPWPLTIWELASRLSYFIWRSGPDDELLGDADVGVDLFDDSVRSDVVATMFTDRRAREMVASFTREWLGVTRRADDPWYLLQTVPPDLLEALERFVTSTIFDGDARLETLLTADYVMANSRIAAWLGLEVEDIIDGIPPNYLRDGCQTGPLGAGDGQVGDQCYQSDDCEGALHCLSTLVPVWSGIQSMCVQVDACATTDCPAGERCVRFDSDRDDTPAQIAACMPEACIPIQTDFDNLPQVWFRARRPDRAAGGLLTQPAVLQAHADVDDRFLASIRRGRFVRERLLCQQVQPPPPGIPMDLPPEGEGGTVREELAEHWKDPFCAGCHVQMDFIGFALESYDARGLHRTHDDQDRLIDVSGELVGTVDIDGPFVGVDELASRLASSTQVADCVVRQWFRFAFGRTETEGDAPVLGELKADFVASGGNLMSLLRAIPNTRTFLERLPPAPPGDADSAGGK